MRLHRSLAFVAAGLFILLPACDPPPAATPDSGVDANVPDGSRDAGRDASGDTGVIIDGNLLIDAGNDAATEEDADVDASGDDAGCSSPASCDDSDECTTDACDVGACSNTPVSVDDGDVCTTDFCDPTDGVGHDAIPDCCETTADCTGGNICSGNLCVPATCTDTVLNGAETSADCGGPDCAPCGLTLACAVNTDCMSGACVGMVCVQCASASMCPGTDTECQTRTCTANVCGFMNVAAGTVTTAQTTGDCHRNECDGSGAIVNAVANGDVPVDGAQCTDDVCTAGAPSNPPAPAGGVCAQSGGVVCNGAGACVACLAPTSCPGTDTECQTRTCTAGMCGFSFQPAGTVTSAQTPGDCQQNQCNGAGMIASVTANGDLPVDGAQCTNDVCTAGVPSNPAVPAGMACTMGGTVCDGVGSCVSAPTVVGTTPADGSMAVASTSIAVTFSTAMNPATLTGQTAAGPCSGSIQVSIDDFATCIAFSSAAAVMTAGNTVATFTAAPGLLVNRTYDIRVTTAAQGASALALASQFTTPVGFITTSPDLCAGSVVIAQVYGAGSNGGALFTHDYILLHNRGTTPVTMTNWSVQYASTAGTSWLVTGFSGTISAGGYFLVQEAGGAVGTPLPTPDATGTIAMAAANGKVALVSSTTALSGSCATGPTVVDFMGYGTANCAETAAAPPLSTTLAAARTTCADIGNNSVDFSAVTPAPLNSASPVAPCACLVRNESGAALEADYCTVVSPLSISVAAAASTPAILGQIYELGTTEAAGVGMGVVAQLGYGPASANPEYEAAWSWANASYDMQIGNNDQYTASFTAPAAGSYRYAYRVSLDRGVSWTVCDQNAGDFGAGSNAGLLFELQSLPVLTVTP